jgi:hypothetical protein
MSGPRDLLRRRGAPAPLAVTMRTEIRSDGGIFFKVLQGPQWARQHSFATIWQWSARLKRKELRDLWEKLRKPDEYGLNAEQYIDFALKKLEIGRYLGTFVDTDVTPVEVRMVFGIQPNRQITETQLTQEIRALLRSAKPGATVPVPPTHVDQNPTPLTPEELRQIRQAATNLADLRSIWLKGSANVDRRSMMLSQVDIQDLIANHSPFRDDGEIDEGQPADDDGG